MKVSNGLIEEVREFVRRVQPSDSSREFVIAGIEPRLIVRVCGRQFEVEFHFNTLCPHRQLMPKMPRRRLNRVPRMLTNVLARVPDLV